jgi:hypothetical protein
LNLAEHFLINEKLCGRRPTPSAERYSGSEADRRKEKRQHNKRQHTKKRRGKKNLYCSDPVQLRLLRKALAGCTTDQATDRGLRRWMNPSHPRRFPAVHVQMNPLWLIWGVGILLLLARLFRGKKKTSGLSKMSYTEFKLISKVTVWRLEMWRSFWYVLCGRLGKRRRERRRVLVHHDRVGS